MARIGLSSLRAMRGPSRRALHDKRNELRSRSFWRRRHWEIVGPERAGWQAFFVPEIHDREIGPAIANGDRFGDRRIAHDDAVSLNLSFSPDEFLVLATNRKSLQ